jgi:Regulator of Chromosome Condensation (RCC1) repeat protein
MSQPTRAVTLRGASITLSLAGAGLSGISCASENIAEPTDAASPVDGATALTLSATLLSFRQLSVGAFHTCGVTTDDQAYRWGYNSLGQLGDGTAIQRPTPVAVAAPR